MYKLIIVEDEEIIREGLCTSINWNEMGFDVVGTADNGKAAIELIHLLKPDAVVADIKMPEMDGIELMSELKTSNPDIKVVILSGYSDFEYARKSVEYSAFSYLLKPVKESEIGEVFGRLKKELDSVNATISRFEQIQKKARIGTFALKEKTMRELIEGKYCDEDKDSLIDALNQDTAYKSDTNTNFCVVLIDAYTGDMKEESKTSGIQSLYGKDELLSIIKETALSNHEKTSVHVLDMIFLEQPGSFALIVSVPDFFTAGELISHTQRIVVRLSELLQAKNCCTPFVYTGIGRSYSDILKLNSSYREAREALSKRFFYKHNTVIHIEDLCGRCASDNTGFKPASQEDKKLVPNIVNSSMACDIQQSWNLIEKYFNPGADIMSADAEQIYVKAIELIIRLSTGLYEKGIELSDVYDGNIHSKIRWIVSFQTLPRLVEYLKEIFERVSEHMKRMNNNKQYISNTIIEKAKKYLNENYNKKLSLEEVASITYMCPTYISTLFRQKTGYTLTDYHIAVKIEKAKNMLKNPDIKIYEVALAVGYEDFRHFSKVFKKLNGISPMQYRENHCNNER